MDLSFFEKKKTNLICVFGVFVSQMNLFPYDSKKIKREKCRKACFYRKTLKTGFS